VFVLASAGFVFFAFHVAFNIVTSIFRTKKCLWPH